MADRLCRGRAVQETGVRHAIPAAEFDSLATKEALSLLAEFIVELREQIAALEHQVVQLRLQVADDAIRLPPSELDG